MLAAAAYRRTGVDLIQREEYELVEHVAAVYLHSVLVCSASVPHVACHAVRLHKLLSVSLKGRRGGACMTARLDLEQVLQSTQGLALG